MMIQARPFTGIAVALLLSATISACGSSPAPPQPQKCTPTYVYSNVKTQGSALYVIDIETDHNGTAQSETYELNDTRSGSFAIENSTVSVTHVNASVDALGQLTDVGAGFVAMGSAQASAAYDH